MRDGLSLSTSEFTRCPCPGYRNSAANSVLFFSQPQVYHTPFCIVSCCSFPTIRRLVFLPTHNHGHGHGPLAEAARPTLHCATVSRNSQPGPGLSIGLISNPLGTVQRRRRQSFIHSPSPSLQLNHEKQLS
jgi:hypothetical protein